VPLEACHAKLDRAEQHLDQLRAEVGNFLAGEPQTTVIEFDAKSGQGRITLSVRARPPITWSVIVGEIVHDWRSALDQLATRLIRRLFLRRSPRLRFPIYADPVKYNAAFGGKLDGLQTYRTILDGLQPYNRGAGYPTHPLWLLYDLSNIDKHEAIHFLGSVAVRSALGIGELNGWNITNLSVRNVTTAYQGAVIATFQLAQTAPGAVLEVRPDLAFDVQIGHGSGSASGKVLLSTLGDIRDFVTNEVFPRFDPLFA
jgi:hypothetical protein